MFKQKFINFEGMIYMKEILEYLKEARRIKYWDRTPAMADDKLDKMINELELNIEVISELKNYTKNEIDKIKDNVSKVDPGSIKDQVEIKVNAQGKRISKSGKFYAVKVGRMPGIYDTWGECKAQIDKFSGAKFHSYVDYDEAVAFMNKDVFVGNKFEIGDKIAYPCAWIDGSYNDSEKVYGYGGFICVDKNDEKREFKGSGIDPTIVIMRNVAGELLGAIRAIKNAIELELNEINIYYDYYGIEMWTNGEWGTDIPFALDYIKFIEEAKNNIKINFFKVDSHTGVPENDRVDILAKEAVGIL